MALDLLPQSLCAEDDSSGEDGGGSIDAADGGPGGARRGGGRGAGWGGGWWKSIDDVMGEGWAVGTRCIEGIDGWRGGLEI